MNVLAERCRRLEEKLARLEQMIRQRNAEIERLDRELLRAKQEKQVEATANEGCPGSYPQAPRADDPLAL